MHNYGIHNPYGEYEAPLTCVALQLPLISFADITAKVGDTVSHTQSN